MKLIKKLNERLASNNKKKYGLFFCDHCKKEVKVEYYNGLRNKSCGCMSKSGGFKHGMYNTKLYNTWRGMIDRCSNKKLKNYAGKGISVCDDWLDFSNFMNWTLGNGYREDLTIDRKNNDLGYYPDNCQFVLLDYNSVKNSKNRLTFEIAEEIRSHDKNKTMTRFEMSEKYGVCKRHIDNIINKRAWRKKYVKR